MTRARDGLCDPCRAKQHHTYNERRRVGLGADDSYYHTSQWRATRSAHMAKEPLCRKCLAATPSRVVAAFGVNHIVPRSQGGGDEDTNLESLCTGHMTSADPRGVVKARANA